MKTEEPPQRPHTLSKDCWCNPTVEYVPPRSASKADDVADG